MVDNVNNDDSDHEVVDAPSEDVLEPTLGKGLPSYRPWDWLAGYIFAAIVILVMFGLSERMYDIAK